MAKIKNYKSVVPVINSIAKIENCLIGAGATAISKTYECGMPTGVMFKVSLGDGEFLTFNLPCNAQGVLDYFIREREKKGARSKPKLTDAVRENIKLQANRTSWKLLSEWIEIQTTLITLRQVKLTQIFLPYMWDGKETLYDKMTAANFKELAQHGA